MTAVFANASNLPDRGLTRRGNSAALALGRSDDLGEHVDPDTPPARGPVKPRRGPTTAQRPLVGAGQIRPEIVADPGDVVEHERPDGRAAEQVKQGVEVAEGVAAMVAQ